MYFSVFNGDIVRWILGFCFFSSNYSIMEILWLVYKGFFIIRVWVVKVGIIFYFSNVF